MKHLYILRHAKSSLPHAKQEDFDRPLTAKGQTDAQVLGERLDRRALRTDCIMASTARRALATARLIAREIRFRQEDIIGERDLYLAALPTLLTIIKKVDDSKQALILVGHNPGLTDLANHLCEHQVDSLPPCGLLCLSMRTKSWQEISEGVGHFEFFDYPSHSTFS